MAPDKETSAEVVDLRTRANFRPDTAALARAQIIAARERLGTTPAEFAEILGALLDWSPSAETVEAWESTSVPPGDVVIAAGIASQAAPLDPNDLAGPDVMARILGKQYADVQAVFASRSEFTSQLPPHALFEGAREIRAAGLSLNLLTQQVPDDELRALLDGGTTLHCLFLAPYGRATGAREQEEDYPAGHLSSLTEMNIRILEQRVRNRLDDEAQARLRIGTYDETIRFNLLLIDDQVAVVQPYLPGIRGLESPTLLLRRRGPSGGLYATFEQTFDWLAGRSTEL